jgi:hypothetical protein
MCQAMPPFAPFHPPRCEFRNHTVLHSKFFILFSPHSARRGWTNAVQPPKKVIPATARSTTLSPGTLRPISAQQLRHAPSPENRLMNLNSPKTDIKLTISVFHYSISQPRRRPQIINLQAINHLARAQRKMVQPIYIRVGKLTQILAKWRHLRVATLHLHVDSGQI